MAMVRREGESAADWYLRLRLALQEHFMKDDGTMREISLYDLMTEIFNRQLVHTRGLSDYAVLLGADVDTDDPVQRDIAWIDMAGLSTDEGVERRSMVGTIAFARASLPTAVLMDIPILHGRQDSLYVQKRLRAAARRRSTGG